MDEQNITIHCSNYDQIIDQSIRYTKVQIEAIKSGTLMGLTMVD